MFGVKLRGRIYNNELNKLKRIIIEHEMDGRFRLFREFCVHKYEISWEIESKRKCLEAKKIAKWHKIATT